MGWIAQIAARRARAEYGTFHAHEWLCFAHARGIHCIERELPDWLPAVLVDRTIVLRRGLSPLEQRWRAWHELSHSLIHPGNILFWASLPWGDRILSKQERQADELALLFPTWSSDELVIVEQWIHRDATEGIAAGLYRDYAA